MTICAAVKVRDGLVLATDSMTQIIQPNLGILKTYSNARKLFRLAELPIGVMSYGIGNIGNRSIESFVREFSGTVVSADVPGATKLLFDFIGSFYSKEFAAVPAGQQPVLGFYIAGYSEKSVFASEWEFLFPRDKAPIEVRPETAFGASWRGIDLPFTRLYMGYDPRMLEPLVKTGVTQGALDAIVQALQSNVVYDGMPVQDAVNFALFIVRTTVGMATFEVGAPTCGGPVQVATIWPDSTFEWVARPSLVID